MEKVRRTGAVDGSRVRYRGDAFAPAAGTYRIADLRSFTLTTQADSGYAPTTVGRVTDLGALAPLAIAALWEAGFAYEAGPLSTWQN
jgi:hypothetical protein